MDQKLTAHATHDIPVMSLLEAEESARAQQRLADFIAYAQSAEHRAQQAIIDRIYFRAIEPADPHSASRWSEE